MESKKIYCFILPIVEDNLGKNVAKLNSFVHNLTTKSSQFHVKSYQFSVLPIYEMIFSLNQEISPDCSQL